MRSILARVAATLGVLALLAIVSLLGFMGLSEISLRSASAINLAGSLRWQSQRLLHLATGPGSSDRGATLARERAVQEFDSRLDDPRLTGVIPLETDHALRVAYDAVKRRWVRDMRERVLRGAPEGAADIAGLVSAYTLEIDGLVRLLETGLEENARKLRLLEVTALSLILLAAIASIWLLYVRVILPLRSLMLVAERIEGGDLSGRAAVTHDDELGQFSRNFNNMVDKLHRAQTALEDRVREKTEQLVRSNRQLELLYKSVRRLSGDDLGHETMHQVLADLQDVLEASVVCLRAVAPDTKLAAGAGEVRPPTDSLSAPLGSAGDCSATDCQECQMRSSASFFGGAAAQGTDRLIVLPLTHAGSVHSYLTVKLKADQPVEPWKVELARAIRRHIEVALGNVRRNEERYRAAVLEERSAMARDLHDSLAQALTYVNVQASRLDSVDPVKRDADASGIVQEIKTGVAAAYRQLRELITTFRTGLDDKTFRLNVEDAVRDCRRRFGINILVEDWPEEAGLSVNERIHVLQIIREALANAAHHARASEVRLMMSGDENRALRVRVEDDGHGMANAGGAEGGHYGLAIMRERASRLGGRLDIGAREGGGTRVELSFVPSACRHEPNASEVRHAD